MKKAWPLLVAAIVAVLPVLLVLLVYEVRAEQHG